MKIKKIPYYLAPWFLMAGASLTIGLLSFGGILAIWPILPLAFAGFVLSVAYEGEIYLQNIKGALKKLFKSNHLERQLAKTCLREHFPLSELSSPDCPQFFKDYERQLQMFHKFEDKRLNKASRDRKRHVEKTLTDMEKWFAVQLFADKDKEGATEYQKNLYAWLNKTQTKKGISLRDEFQVKRGSRHGIYKLLTVFCVTAGLFMGLGTSYLLVEAFAIIPWLAVLSAPMLPVLIVPMALIAGVAYGLLVYNAMTDMIATEMVTKWYDKLKDNDPKTYTRRVVMGIGLAFMFTLTLALSICTAGTWWTVAKTSRPLFQWMGKMPAFIMLVLNPFISSLSTWAFNLENVSETLELVEDWFDKIDMKAVRSWPRQWFNFIISIPSVLMSSLSTWRFNPEEKTTLQLLRTWNLPRMVIAIAFAPLRFMLFIGHLVSIGVTADRVPGVPPVLSAVLGSANEGVEDLHYFDIFGKQQHVCKHDTPSLLKQRLEGAGGHNHDTDLPTKFLTVVLLPLYVLAAGWDVMCDDTREELDSWEAFGRVFGKALDREMGLAEEEHVEYSSFETCGVKTPEEVKPEYAEEVAPEPANAKPKAKTKAKKTRAKAKSQAPLATPPEWAWQFEHAVYRIERHKEKHLQSTADSHTFNEQKEKLSALQKELGEHAVPASTEFCAAPPPPIAKLIKKHHAFFKSADKAATDDFLKSLEARVAPAA